MAFQETTSAPNEGRSPEFHYVELPQEDFRLRVSAGDVPFLAAMSRMGVGFSIFFGLLAVASLAFVRTTELVVVDLLAVAVSALLLACSTIGIRIAAAVLNRSLQHEVRP